MASHNDIGEKGELIAFTFLKDEGYSVIEKNWRHKRDELDIIALKDGVLVFIEVKTRTNAYAGEPAAAVSRGKQKRILRAANEFIKIFDGFESIRFDIIGIISNSNEKQIEHIEDAFYPTL
jgi:putative endonuclease